MGNILDYDHDESYLPDDCIAKISPSQFSKFIEKKHQWYREVILKEDGFAGSTASVIGTVVHYIAECVASKQPIDKDAIYEYVHDQVGKPGLEDYCESTVLESFEEMASVLINDYVLANMDNYHAVEKRVTANIGKGLYASGMYDFTEGTKDDLCIGDYKTYSSKTKPKSIPQNYKYQLLVYAYILTKLGYNVTRIKLVYINRRIDGGISEKTGKPLKCYPPEVTVLVETITDEDMEFITGLLELCADTVEASNKHPELRHVIWADPRLKQGAK